MMSLSARWWASKLFMESTAGMSKLCWKTIYFFVNCWLLSSSEDNFFDQINCLANITIDSYPIAIEQSCDTSVKKYWKHWHKRNVTSYRFFILFSCFSVFQNFFSFTKLPIYLHCSLFSMVSMNLFVPLVS